MFTSTDLTAAHLWALETPPSFHMLHIFYISQHTLRSKDGEKRGRTRSCYFKHHVSKKVPHCWGNHRPACVLHFSVLLVLNARSTPFGTSQPYWQGPQVVPEITTLSQLYHSLSQPSCFGRLVIFAVTTLRHTRWLPSKGFRFHLH